MAWRQITDWGKRNGACCASPTGWGRGKGRMRLLDRVATPPAPLRPDLHRWLDHELSAVWIGHATVLLASAAPQF